jgi:hypothetical protein
MYLVKVRNIHAKFHRGRADQVGQTAAELARLAGVVVLPTETALAPLAFARRDHLGGVFASLQRSQRRRGVTVETLEEGVDGWRHAGIAGAASAARIDRLRWQWAAITRAPEQRRRLELVELMVVHRIKAHEKTLAEQ